MRFRWTSPATGCGGKAVRSRCGPSRGTYSAFYWAPGLLVSKDALHREVWPDAAVSDDTLTKSIGELRRALGDDPRTPRFIETVHGRGFRFVADVQGMQDEARGAVPAADSQARTAASESGVAGLPFVGRQPELDRLLECLAWGEGSRQLVFITGEAGVGKTRRRGVSGFPGVAWTGRPCAPRAVYSATRAARTLYARSGGVRTGAEVAARPGDDSAVRAGGAVLVCPGPVAAGRARAGGVPRCVGERTARTNAAGGRDLSGIDGGPVHGRPGPRGCALERHGHYHLLHCSGNGRFPPGCSSSRRTVPPKPA